MSGFARLLVLDIETRPTSNRVLLEREVMEAVGKRPPGNASAKVKGEWDMEETRAGREREAILKTMVDKLLAELLVVAWRADGVPMAGVAMSGDEERRLLAAVAEEWGKVLGPETVIAGHNIKGFDLPILLNGFRRHGITPPEHFPAFRRGRWSGCVYDTMENAPANTPFVSLSDLYAAYGLGDAKGVMWRGEPMHGGRVLEAFEAGEFAMLADYCGDDVLKEEELYLRMTAGDVWGTFGLEGLRARVREIEGMDLTEDQKTVAVGRMVRAGGI